METMRWFMTKQKKEDITIGILFTVLLSGYIFFTYRLFYNQCINVDHFPLFVSDMKAYMQTVLGQESGYNFPYPIFFWLIRLVHTVYPIEQATALTTTLLNAGSIGVLFSFMYDDLCMKKRRLLYKTGLILLVFSLFFVSMIYAPSGIYLPGMDHKYLGVFTANPYHNATYLATRPFSIVAFYLFTRIWDHYEQYLKISECIWFTFFLLLTTMTKPSFTLVFGMAAVIVLSGELVLKKGKNWKKILIWGLCFLPTTCDLLYQYRGVFSTKTLPAEDVGIGVGFFSAWSLYCHNIPLAVILALAFPGFYLLLHLKDIKRNKIFCLTWILVCCAFVSVAFLYEKGERFDDLNFSWGYMHAIFFAFSVTLEMLIRDTMAFSKAIKRSELRGIELVLEWCIYIGHFICGLHYFIYLYSGHEHMAF